MTAQYEFTKPAEWDHEGSSRFQNRDLPFCVTPPYKVYGRLKVYWTVNVTKKNTDGPLTTAEILRIVIRHGSRDGMARCGVPRVEGFDYDMVHNQMQWKINVSWEKTNFVEVDSSQLCIIPVKEIRAYDISPSLEEEELQKWYS